MLDEIARRPAGRDRRAARPRPRHLPAAARDPAASPRRCRPPPAARRLPTSVEVEDVGRYPQEIEAAVYFCCLEALQNAGKHAGDDASVTRHVCDERRRGCSFEVADDGAGFDRSHGAAAGHGFVNMSDRGSGAIGGTLHVRVRPGSAGTQLTAARIPLRSV